MIEITLFDKLIKSFKRCNHFLRREYNIFDPKLESQKTRSERLVILV
jgi:hypothetical protein